MRVRREIPGRNAAAPARASGARTGSELRTTHLKSASGLSAASLSIVPPQPISMSSQCAPRQRTCSGKPWRAPSAKGSISGTPAARRGSSLHDLLGLVPDLPRRMAPRIELLQPLTVLERVHRHPEAVVGIGDELAFPDEALEGLQHELLSVVDVLEDLLAEGEEAGVDPEVDPGDVRDAGDAAVPLERDEVVGEVRLHAQEGADLAVVLEV